jgi:triacylglycerol lipase
VLSSLSPARRRLVVICGALVMVAVLVVAAFVVVSLTGGSDKTPVAQDVPGPVILIPGYGGSTDSLTKLTADLRSHGRDAQVLSLPGDGTGDLDAQAILLGQAATAAMARTGAKSVDVVGYSAGGVVARLWVRDHGGASVARRIVTLGSPHHGTSLAQLAQTIAPSQCPQACQQLVPNSDLLRALNAGDETPSGPQFVSIWTTADDVVMPADSARLDGALNLTVQSVCADNVVKHTGLPADPLVMSLVLLELGANAPSTPAKSQCASLSS